ncbi:MAG: AraC family transcriptional regulator [Eubacteriales bacterium]|nr:AraC family transcriptional regulator [Eubacteriales bacterium]
MGHEFEVITHNRANYHIFLVQLLSRTPHIHMDFELLAILDGAVTVETAVTQDTMHAGDICVLNPLQSHEFYTKSPALILSLQVPSSFFMPGCPEIENLEFAKPFLTANENPALCEDLTRQMKDIASAHFRQDPWYSLHCTAMLNTLFLTLLEHVDYRILAEKEHRQNQIRGNRIRRILEYIGEHSGERLLLRSIAEQEGLSLYYLSHLFREYMGMSFQEYLSIIRCDQARNLLTATEMPLLDISVSCGFSDPKYFTAQFRRRYGCTPKQYRKEMRSDAGQMQPDDPTTSQRILSGHEALHMLEKLSDH